MAYWRHSRSKHGIQQSRRSEQHHHNLPTGCCD